MHSLLPLADIVDNMRDIGTQTGFTLPQFLAQCIAVLVMFSFLWYFAWKPVRTMLEQRRTTIEQSMANADRIKKELADAEATRLSIVQKANEQANSLIAEAEKAAIARGEQRTQEATRQAEDIIKKAHEASVLERDRLLAELKREVGALVIQTTEKIAGKILTPDDQNRLNDETSRQLTASSN
jgi:F-type H+-transporting ATPase subunit b